MKQGSGRFRLVMMTAVWLLWAGGCRDGDEERAIAEAAQARAELVKAQAEIAALKGERSFIREKLQTAELAVAQIQEQLEQALEEQGNMLADANTADETYERMVTLLNEQSKSAEAVRAQNEQLKLAVQRLTELARQQEAIIKDQKERLEHLRGQDDANRPESSG